MIKHNHNKVGKRTPEYTAWWNMIQRCTNPKHISYVNYGKRGITVCPRWERSFVSFLKDMGVKPLPSRGHTLERVDNSKGYSPKNCKWATYSENLRNRRGIRMIQYDGKTQSLVQWSREVGISMKRIHARLKKGWSVARALNESINKKYINNLA